MSEQMASQAPQHRDGPAGVPVYASGTQRLPVRDHVRVACPRGLGRAHRASELLPSLPSDRLDGTEVSWFVHAGSTCPGSMSSGEVGTAVGTAL